MAFHLHREDIKARLRKRFRSVTAFERAKGLPAKSVSDVLRGRSSAATERAIIEELFTQDSKAAKRTKKRSGESDISDKASTVDAQSHRLTIVVR